MQNRPFLTAAFYQFAELADYADRKAPLLAVCEQHHIKGTILLAREGINSTVAGAPDDVRALLAYLRSDPLLAKLQHKESWAEVAPFRRMKVHLKREIVTMGVPGVDPTRLVGTYVRPEDWNALISDPDVVVVDTRNDYEVAIGTFQGAIDPHIRTFGELPAWVDQAEALQARGGKKPKVAYHLDGGILKYLETIPPEQSLWAGTCFVFDERVSVDHGVVPGTHKLCRGCRMPLEEGALESPLYEAGVSCPRCHATTSDTQKARARERQRQWELAKARAQKAADPTQ